MYDELPAQLTGPAVEAIRANLRAALELRDEIKALRPVQRRQLPGYVDQARELLMAVYHGERDRFYTPQTDAMRLLDNLQGEGNATIQQQFSKSKTALQSALSLYCKGLQSGLKEYDKEASQAPRG